MYKNPYQNLSGGKWYKTNFHTHAGTGSGCGKHPLDKVIETYVASGFEMLCISNHDTYVDATSFTDDKILIIPGVEYSTNPHMLTIGIDKPLAEYGHQEAVDITKEMGGFTILCHPNWKKKEYWSNESIDGLKGFTGIEVMNAVINRLSGSSMALDTWDHILTNGRMTYGFGNDDFHEYFDASRNFNWIYCSQRSMDSMKSAVTNGTFCASSGLMPDYLLLEGETINVKAKFPGDNYVDSFTYRFIGENGAVLSVQRGSAAQYSLNGEKYVRVEAIGENGALLFFQPVYLTEAFTHTQVY